MPKRHSPKQGPGLQPAFSIAPPPPIQILNLGSCGIHSPQFPLNAQGYVPYIWHAIGFRVTPYALSSGGAVQLVDFCSGDIDLPEHTRWLAYMDEGKPGPQARAILDRSDFILVELSTPFELLLDGVILNFGAIAERIRDPLKEVVDKKLVQHWVNALTRAHEDERAPAAAEILRQLPADCDPQWRHAVDGLRSRQLDVDQMERDLRAVRERVAAPMGMALYDFRYMPDGRPIDWPANFKSDQREIARRLDIPTMDFAPAVEKLGPAEVLMPDFVHWRESAYPIQGEMIYDFVASCLDRPRLKDLPRAIPPFPGPEGYWDMSRHANPVLAELPGRLRAALRAVHEPRIAELGVDGSGLLAHYESLLSRDMVFGPREEAVVQLILDHLPEVSRYAVMQAGLGQLALALGMAGKRVTAHDVWPHRREAIKAGVEYFEREGLIKPGLVTVADGFPERGKKAGSVMAVGLEATCYYDDALQQAAIDKLAQLDAVLFEPRALLRLRAPGPEQDWLTERLARNGLTDAGAIPSLGLTFFHRPA